MAGTGGVREACAKGWDGGGSREDVAGEREST
jgi:hypothetical protein